MGSDDIVLPSFQMVVRDPFLEALISIVAEPNGSSTARQAYEATRDWWDDHARGPTAAELLDSMFEPTNWLSVIDDSRSPQATQRAQVELLREWLVLYWARIGAISFVAGVDAVLRPGRPSR